VLVNARLNSYVCKKMHLFFTLTQSFSVVEDLFFVNFVRRVANGDTSGLNNNIIKHGPFLQHQILFYLISEMPSH